MILYSHPTGNTYVRQSVRALAEADLLAEFWTGIHWNPNARLAQLLPPSLRKQMERRAFPVAARDKIRSFPWREAGRLAASRLRLTNLTRHEVGPLSVDAVFHDLDRHVAKRVKQLDGLTGVYAGEDGALETFRAAKSSGMLRVYELPIAYWEIGHQLMAEEAERWPAWEQTLSGTRDSDAKRKRKTEELELADIIVTPSLFVRNSLPDATRRRKTCIVTPFGSPCVPMEKERRGQDGPLRVLFAGSMSQRKGLADVFAAMKLVQRKDVELIVMGSPQASHEFYRAEYAGFQWESPRPHADVLALMQTCDVFILPSIVEGRALVQQEAMACGLPLIVTANAGGEDLIDEGVTGFTVPIRSPEAIAEKIVWFTEHRDALPAMRDAARYKAAEYTWEGYGQKIVAAIQSRLAAAHV